MFSSHKFLKYHAIIFAQIICVNFLHFKMHIMEYILMNSYLSAVLLGVVASTTCSQLQKLTAVSNRDIAEALYRRVKAEEPFATRPYELCTNCKDQLCYDITGSGLFRNYWKEKWVSIPSMEFELKKYYRNVYESLFQPCGKATCYVNRIQKMPNVYHSAVVEKSDEPFKEYVFRCLTTKDREIWDQKREDLFVYYISGEYNLNDGRNPYSPGRFVFAYTDTTTKSRMIPQAVAERPALLSLAHGIDVENWYLEWRDAADTEVDEKSTKSEHNGTCSLSKAQRQRVCSLLLSSEYFEKKMIFTPLDDNVGEGCDEKTISFKFENTDGITYSQKMVSCKADVYHAHHKRKIYFSRVDNYPARDMAFVYHPVPGSSEVVITALFHDVRFVI